MAARTFSQEDQTLFAELSGDSNALHVSPLEARRTLFGRQVVHGIHLLLWSLETLLKKPCRLTKLNVTFGRPVGVGETVSCQVVRADDKGMDIVLESRGATCAWIRIEVTDEPQSSPFLSGTPPQPGPRVMEPADAGTAQGELDLYYDEDRYGRLLGSREHQLPPGQIAFLLASTRLVGMECPGAHSIYSQISLTFQTSLLLAGPHPRSRSLAPSHSPGPQALADNERPVMKWRVETFNPRFGRVTMKVAARGCSGTIIAFLRPHPQRQLSFQQARTRIPAELFSGQTALVVGGSRGIGEACAKILAAGGARVYLTYHRGATDAEAVVQDIRSGGAVATAFAFDVRQPSNLATVFGDRLPSHVYYFPTPPVFVASKEHFSHDIFNLFYEIYVRGLLNTYGALRAISTDEVDIYYPSSDAVTHIQNNMGEYAAAKAAGETVCRYLAVRDRKVKIRIDRLPRLPTDQTASVLGVPSNDPVEVLLQALTNTTSTRLDAETGQIEAPRTRPPA